MFTAENQRPFCKARVNSPAETVNDLDVLAYFTYLDHSIHFRVLDKATQQQNRTFLKHETRYSVLKRD